MSGFVFIFIDFLRGKGRGGEEVVAMCVDETGVRGSGNH